MDQFNQQSTTVSTDKCPSANGIDDDKIRNEGEDEDGGDDKIRDEDEDEDEDEDDEINHVTEKIKLRRPSKWRPVWPGFNCLDCFGCCFFFYILCGCDNSKDSKIESSADLTIKSTSLFDYDLINQQQQRPRRPTQMNIPLESEVIKKNSIVSTTTINDNNEHL